MFVFTTLLGVSQSPGYIYDFAGQSNNYGFSGDGGPATSAFLYAPLGIKIALDGSVYIADTFNHRVRKIGVDGTITTIAGTGVGGYNGDGYAATSSQLNQPGDIAIDSAGNLYISDRGNGRIRKLDAHTGLMSTLAGDGNVGYSGDGGPSTQSVVKSVAYMVINPNNNLDFVDSAANVVREINLQTGIITTVAGTGIQGYSGDGGPATAARLDSPTAVTFDHKGNFYVADASVVRKVVLSTGLISTIAGQYGQPLYGADGGQALGTFVSAHNIVLDAQDNLYIGDLSGVRKIDQSGTITTVVGKSTNTGQTPDGVAATAYGLQGTEGMAFDTSGSLYVSDGFYRVRKVFALSPSSSPSQFTHLPLHYACSYGPVTNADGPLRVGGGDANLYDTQGQLTICTYSQFAAASFITSTPLTLSFNASGGSGSNGKDYVSTVGFRQTQSFGGTYNVSVPVGTDLYKLSITAYSKGGVAGDTTGVSIGGFYLQ